MSARFHTISYNPDMLESENSVAVPDGLRAELGANIVSEEVQYRRANLASDEAIARRYADRLLQAMGSEDFLPTISPQTTEIVPGLSLERTEELPAGAARTLHFEQHMEGIPVFGTNAVVELDANTGALKSFDAILSSSPDISPIPTVSIEQAIGNIEKYCGEELSEGDIRPPKICFYAASENDEWHLVYNFHSVPAVPSEVREAEQGDTHCHGDDSTPREDFRRYDFLVDAHSGALVYYFSALPFIDVPIDCQGLDEFGHQRGFFGRSNGRNIEMVDPLRGIETFDHRLNDIEVAPPADPVQNSVTDFGATNPAAVSAHHHATLVFDFFNHVLKRNGIDGKGMPLVSIVNSTYSHGSPPPIWRNAVWYENRMWYGQFRGADGRLESYAQYLDVIAHELTHGVTQSTSDLVYRDESGALNESFSDIFGVMVKNWYPSEPNPVANWDWEIGSGLDGGSSPLRDMSDPTLTNDPDHWNDREHIGTPVDNGGVHVNSNIHNKAAYNLFNAADDRGNLILQPKEIGILYYLTLVRLSRMATFQDCLRVLKSVAATYFQGNSNRSNEVRSAIEDAYSSVGIN